MIAAFILSCGIIWTALFGCEGTVPFSNAIVETNRQEEATERARIAAETEQARVEAAALVAAEKERTQQNLQTQIHAAERLHAEQRARTERHQNFMMVLIAFVITGGLVAIVFLCRGGAELVIKPAPTYLPPPKQQMLLADFLKLAAQNDWRGFDVQEDRQGNEYGVQVLPGQPPRRVLLLTDNNV